MKSIIRISIILTIAAAGMTLILGEETNQTDSSFIACFLAHKITGISLLIATGCLFNYWRNDRVIRKIRRLYEEE